ncbi:hypothetical protein M3B46_06745 [Sphingobacterium daejeonense]|uniref:hypothetical protein n=1 Tax=Sphingobacterium daejeonense TaxID=371142 RepID=UPI0021A381EE|nr:hypothetical protein [Sphingobacterium daejeonense]MCT1530683.1 hypothetical protein [Sphingobacterium daejeonense]
MDNARELATILYDVYWNFQQKEPDWAIVDDRINQLGISIDRCSRNELIDRYVLEKCRIVLSDFRLSAENQGRHLSTSFVVLKDLCEKLSGKQPPRNSCV